MGVTQYTLLVLALVRVSAAIAMFDLYRRLHRPSVAPLAIGLALYATEPLAVLFLGVEESLTFPLQVVATVLIVLGVAGHLTRLTVRATLVGTAAAVLVGIGGLVAFDGYPALLDASFLVASAVLAVLLVRSREQFRREAGSSYAWGLVIVVLVGVTYAMRLSLPEGSIFRFADEFLRVIVSVALGLYLLNLEFNSSYIAQGRIEGRYRTLFDSAGDAIFVLDFKGKILDANELAAEQLGYSVRQLRRMHISEIDDDQNASMVASRMERIQEQGSAVFQSVHARHDGSLMPVEVSAVMFEWEGQPAVLGIVRDLSERKRTEELILHMAYYDSLTGLANRFLFNDRLAQAVVRSRRTGEGLALLFMDLDNFKTLNDTLGHPMGDRLLIAVGERLKALVREGDTVARLGGDEYTLLLPQVMTEEGAAEVAWKVLEALETPFMLDGGHEIHASASIGIALSQSGEETPDELVRNADIAMFRAKERGRNTYHFYDPEMNAVAIQRFELKNELRRALEGGELEVQYQPRVRVADTCITGAEALLRWHSPTRGDVPPSLFIPLAEESGLIVPIGRWVFSEACRTVMEWRAAGFDNVSVSVNLSTRQLVADDLIDFIAETLTEFRVPPGCVELEITESVAMQHSGAAIEAFHRLGEMGVRLAIDDFGTGYSSLDRLKRLPIHTLKVAQPFVEDIGDAEDASAIVTTIIVLGHSLGMSVVAEGVETQLQLEFLRAHSCDQMQGFLFSPAVPKEHFLEMLADTGPGSPCWTRIASGG